MSKLRTTAAWRISILTALAYALGTAITFSIVYFFVAQGIRERSDAWLSGEAAVLVRVSADTPRDRLYNRAVREVAELAARELPEERNAAGQNLNAVFFLEEDPSDRQGPLWVGPSSNDVFLQGNWASESRFGRPAVHKSRRLAHKFSSRCPTSKAEGLSIWDFPVVALPIRFTA